MKVLNTTADDAFTFCNTHTHPFSLPPNQGFCSSLAHINKQHKKDIPDFKSTLLLCSEWFCVV